MQIAICSDDIVTGTGFGAVDGWPIPPALSDVPIAHLRLRDGEIINAADNTVWFIDQAGRKHITAQDGTQQVECSIDDRLYQDAEGRWRTAGIAEIRAAKLVQLSNRCGQEIVGGFLSAALGEPHRYPSNITDQINLMGSVTDSLVPGLPEEWRTPFWCCDSSGTWNWKMHTADQIQQAGRDGKAHVVNCQSILAQLTDQVEQAETAAAVNAITWPVVPET